MTKDEQYMQEALVEARKAYELGEIPIGAILVHDDTIISRHHNRRELDHDATAHAEILVIREACESLQRWRLTGCTLYVTIEPCPMCAGAIINSRIDRVVYGASDYKGGAVESLFNVLSHPGLNHEPELTAGVLGDECSQIMKDFFKERRKARRSTQEAEGSALEMR
ncbi:tRNA adenosine(34) deaminase TadA [Veillonella sp. AS16]|uniref:tRNA adenosine(34) deaminase TadA n=1 Tax=Veillonella sp. AS16 TaxID=936589 RepID=UPI000906F73B|nr:tRNA adenosine(34) deaminase TadA [Veillonella sp. AS16]